jgi:hypothetical protein
MTCYGATKISGILVELAEAGWSRWGLKQESRYPKSRSPYYFLGISNKRLRTSLIMAPEGSGVPRFVTRL